MHSAQHTPNPGSVDLVDELYNLISKQQEENVILLPDSIRTVSKVKGDQWSQINTCMLKGILNSEKSRIDEAMLELDKTCKFYQVSLIASCPFPRSLQIHPFG